MNKETPKDSIWKNCITIPNMLSVFRLILIPFFVYAYCVEQNFWKTAALLALSGISDTADGYIARRFNMVSDLGKIIDPVADKLTQAAMLLCLLTRYPLMLLPLLLLHRLPLLHRLLPLHQRLLLLRVLPAQLRLKLLCRVLSLILRLASAIQFQAVLFFAFLKL